MGAMIHECFLSGDPDGFMEVRAHTSGDTAEEALGAAQMVLDLIGAGKERLIRSGPVANEHHDFAFGRTTYLGHVRFAFRNAEGEDRRRPEGPGGVAVMYGFGKPEGETTA